MKRIVQIAMVLWLGLACCGPSLADMFIWVDANGVKHFGDAPPQELADENSLEVRRAYRRQLEARKEEAVSSVVNQRNDFFSGGGRSENMARPAEAARVVMFSTPSCGYCVKAKNYFRQKGVAFEELNINASEDARRRFQDLGGRGVPLILIGERKINGFDQQAIQAALSKEGLI